MTITLTLQLDFTPIADRKVKVKAKLKAPAKDSDGNPVDKPTVGEHLREALRQATFGNRNNLVSRLLDGEPKFTVTRSDVLAVNWLSQAIAQMARDLRLVLELSLEGVRFEGKADEFVLAHFADDRYEFLGPLVLDEKLLVLDPCYNDIGGLGAVIDALPGVWHGEARRKVARSFGSAIDERCWEIRAYHTSVKRDIFETPGTVVGNAAVDSGQLGIFRRSGHPDCAQDDYDAICSHTLRNDDRTFGNTGWFVSTGWGDGGYNVETWADKDGKVVAIRVVFISDADFDPVDDEEYASELAGEAACS